MAATKAPTRTATASDLKVKAREDDLRPLLVEAGILGGDGGGDGGADEGAGAAMPEHIKLKHLQALAQHWGLDEKSRNFWKKYRTYDDLLRVLHNNMGEAAKAKGARKRASKLGMISGIPETHSGDDSDGDYHTVFKPYQGDIFGTRGDYTDGLVMASRMHTPTPAPAEDAAPATPSRHGRATTTPSASASVSPSHKRGRHGSTTGSDVGGAPPAHRRAADGDDHRAAGAATAASPLGAALDAVTESDPAPHDGAEDAGSRASSPSGLSSEGGDAGEDGDAGEASSSGVMGAALFLTGDINMKRSCAAALRNMSAKPKMRAGMVKGGAIAALLSLHDTPDDAIRADCLTALCNVLAAVPLRELGGLPTRKGALNLVFHGCDAPQAAIRELCMRTLVHMSSPASGGETDSQAALVDEGVTAVVCSLAQARSRPVEAALQATLLNALAEAKRNRPLLVREGAVPALLQIATEAPMSDAATTATGALLRIIQHKDTLKSVIAEGVCGALAPMMTIAVRETGVNVLRTLSEASHDAEGRAALMEVRALAYLLEVASEGRGRADDAAVGGAGGDEAGCAPHELGTSIVRELALDESCRQQLIEEGAVPALVALSGAGNTLAERNCAVALCSLLLTGAGNAAAEQEGDNAEQNLMQMGALGALGALSRSKDASLQLKAASTLCDLSCEPELGAKLVEEGGLDTVANLSVADDLSIRRFCATTLRNLSALPRNHAALVDGRILDALVELATANDASIRVACAKSFSNLTYHEDGRQAMADAGCADTLLALSHFDASKPHVGVGLCNLSMYRPLRRALIERGVVPVLIGLARSTSGTVKQDCVRALCNLSSDAGCEAEMSQNGAASGLVMVALFGSDRMETKALCVRALFNLMSAPDARRALIGEEVVWAFAKLGSMSASEGVGTAVKTLCAHALLSLSCDARVRPKVLAQKAITSLTVVAQEESAATRRAVAAALRNLTWDAGSGIRMVREGIVDALRSLMQRPLPTITHHVACALCNLSATDAACEALVEHGVVDVLLQLCQSDSAQVSNCCGITLANLTSLARPAAMAQLLRTRVVAAIIVVTSAPAPSTVALAMHALYNLSCVPAVLVDLADTGATRALVAAVDAAVGPLGEDGLPERAPAGKSADKDSRSEAILRLAAATACNLARSESGACAERLVSGGVITALVRTLWRTCRADTAQFAIHALAHLSAYAPGIDAVTDAGVARVVARRAVAVVRDNADGLAGMSPAVAADVRAAALCTLCNLSHSTNPATRQRLSEDGAVAGVVALAGDAVLAAMARAEATATAAEGSRGAGDSRADRRTSISSSDSEDSLGKLAGGGAGLGLGSEEWEPLPQVQAVCHTLWHMTFEPTVAAQTTKDGLPAILAFASHPELDIQNLMASALANLARCAPAGLNAVPRVGRVLAALAKSDDEDTKNVATIALRSLGASGDSQAQLMEDGGMEMLLQMMVSAGGADDEVMPGGAMAPVGRVARLHWGLVPPNDDALLRNSRPKGHALERAPSKFALLGVGYEGAGAAVGAPSAWLTVAEQPKRAKGSPVVSALSIREAGAVDDADGKDTAEAATEAAGEHIDLESSPYATREAALGAVHSGDLDSIDARRMWPKVKEGGLAVSGLSAVGDADNVGDAGSHEGAADDAADAPAAANQRVNSYFQPRLRGTWASPVKPLPLHVRLGVEAAVGPATPGSHGTPRSPYARLTPGEGRPGTAPAGGGDGPAAAGGAGSAAAQSPRAQLEPLDPGSRQRAQEAGAKALRGSGLVAAQKPRPHTSAGQPRAKGSRLSPLKSPSRTRRR